MQKSKKKKKNAKLVEDTFNILTMTTQINCLQKKTNESYNNIYIYIYVHRKLFKQNEGKLIISEL